MEDCHNNVIWKVPPLYAAATVLITPEVGRLNAFKEAYYRTA
jgi:hypothetical protein